MLYDTAKAIGLRASEDTRHVRNDRPLSVRACGLASARRRLEENYLCGSVPEALVNASQAIDDFQAMFPWSLPGCPCCTELEDNPLWCCARWTFANIPAGDPYDGGGLMELCNPDC